MRTHTLPLPLLLALTPLTSAQSSTLSTNMSIQIYSLPGCPPPTPSSTTNSTWNYQLTYNTDIVFPHVPSFQSYELSRDTTLQEQLDFSESTPNEGDLYGIDKGQCTLFHETTSPDSNGNPLKAETCYGLEEGAAEVSGIFVLCSFNIFFRNEFERSVF